MMSRILLIFILLSSLSSPIVAGQESEDAVATCTAISVVARDIMTARQDNVPMATTLPAALQGLKRFYEEYVGDWEQAVEEKPATIRELQQLMSMIVREAYGFPLATTEADRMALIREFEDELFGGCVEGMQSAGQ